MRRFICLLLIAASALVLNPSVAGADCAGPTVEHDSGEVQAGDTILVEGMWWGDNCYDTGPPPDGEDVLGKPIRNIEVFLMQGELELLVAEGDADANYGFTVLVTVPSELSGGKFTVVVKSGAYQGWVQTVEPLAFVSSDEVVEAAVAPFDTPDEPAVEQSRENPIPVDEVDEEAGEADDGESAGFGWVMPTIGIAILFAVAGMLIRR